MTVTERADGSGVVSVLSIRPTTTSDSGIYQCRSTSDRSVAIRRVHVLNGQSVCTTFLDRGVVGRGCADAYFIFCNCCMICVLVFFLSFSFLTFAFVVCCFY